MLRKAEIEWKEYIDIDPLDREIMIDLETKKYNEPLVQQSVIPLSMNDKLDLYEKFEQKRKENIERKLRGEKVIIL